MLDRLRVRAGPSVAAAALACAPHLGGAADRHAYVAEHERIDAEYRAVMQRCDRDSGHARDLCVAEARAARRIAKVDAEARAKDTPKAWHDARIARAEAEFLVAKERCGAFADNAKDGCVSEARAAEARAKAEAERARRDAEAGHDSQAERARCDALAGEARQQCLANARKPTGGS
jgi:hypothetical protein